MSSPSDEESFEHSTLLPRIRDKGLENLSEESTESSQRIPSMEKLILETNLMSMRLDEERNADVQKAVADAQSPKEILQRTLSIHSVIYTSPFFARQHSQPATRQLLFRKIGFGECGLVFEQPGSQVVFKVARHERDATLWEDYINQSTICESWDKYQRYFSVPVVQIPKPFFYVNSGAESWSLAWWKENLGRFLQDKTTPQMPTNVLAMERIPSLPKAIRYALIDAFSPDHLKEDAKRNHINRDCIARLYLGRRQKRYAPEIISQQRQFTMRNYGFHIDQMEALGLNIDDFCDGMAEALAIIHWQAKSDARDVEFVLGGAPTLTVDMVPSEELLQMPLNSTTIIFRRRVVYMWVLDFNLVNRFKPAEPIVDHLVNEFFDNDPYYPLPCAETPRYQDLWRRFAETYVNISRKILSHTEYDCEGESLLHLPALFITKCEEREKNNLANGLGHGVCTKVPQGHAHY